MGGRIVSRRDAGARLYVKSGMSREVTQLLGGWRSSEVMERLYCRVRPRVVVPEMRADLGQASDRWNLERFVKELEEDPNFVEKREAGLALCAYSRHRPAHFFRASDLLTTEVATPLCSGSLSLMGRPVRSSGLPDDQKRAIGARRERSSLPAATWYAIAIQPYPPVPSRTVVRVVFLLWRGSELRVFGFSFLAQAKTVVFLR